MSPKPVVLVQSSKVLPAKKADSVSCTSGGGAKKKVVGRRKGKDKPKRPLSAYNIFFQHERDRMLRSIASPFGFAHDTNHCTLGRDPSKRTDRSKKVRPPPHGKIGFAELARTIGHRWKNVDPHTRSYFDDLAKREKRRYTAELEVWHRRAVAKKEGSDGGSSGSDGEPGSPTSSPRAGPSRPPLPLILPNATTSSGGTMQLPPPPPPPPGYERQEEPLRSAPSTATNSSHYYSGHNYSDFAAPQTSSSRDLPSSASSHNHGAHYMAQHRHHSCHTWSPPTYPHHYPQHLQNAAAAPDSDKVSAHWRSSQPLAQPAGHHNEGGAPYDPQQAIQDPDMLAFLTKFICD